MKQRILQIQNNKALTPREKAVSMQQLMMQRWTQSQDKGTDPVPMDVEELDQSKVTTYHNEQNNELGCEHYK